MVAMETAEKQKSSSTQLIDAAPRDFCTDSFITNDAIKWAIVSKKAEIFWRSSRRSSPVFRGGPLPRFSPIQCEVSGTSQLETTFENSCNNDGWVEVLMGLQTRLLF